MKAITQLLVRSCASTQWKIKREKYSSWGCGTTINIGVPMMVGKYQKELKKVRGH